MKTTRPLSLFLVTLQFALIGAILLSGPIFARSIGFLLLECLGLALALWAIIVMRPGRFNIVPDVPQGATLTTRGPYRVVRHPMYTSVLVTTLALTLDAPSILRAAFWLALCGVMITKLRYEEKLLATRFPSYAGYRRGTYRLFPYLF